MDRKPTAKDFGFIIPEGEVDRQRSWVTIEYGGRRYPWFLREDGRTCILRSGNENELTSEARNAMKDQVRAILKRKVS